jgi:hypothetical protein
MAQSRKDRRPQTEHWHHLGATGVLQPLSGEFLYRSPHDGYAHARRRPRSLSRRADHAAD